SFPGRTSQIVLPAPRRYNAPGVPAPWRSDRAVTDQILETAVVAMAAFFATIGPLDVAAIFAALTPTATRRARRSMAVRGVLIAAGILVSVALVGEPLLDTLGVSLPALRTAGGILLLLIGIE